MNQVCIYQDGWTLPEEIPFQADFIEAVAELSAASIYFLEATEALFSIKFPIFLAFSAVSTKLYETKQWQTATKNAAMWKFWTLEIIRIWNSLFYLN